MGHPWITAQNPAYPGLLDPPESRKELVQSNQMDERQSSADSEQSTAECSTSIRSCSPSPSLNCFDEWALSDDDIADEGGISSVHRENYLAHREVTFSMTGLE